jgi:hypothetical protein
MIKISLAAAIHSSQCRKENIYNVRQKFYCRNQPNKVRNYLRHQEYTASTWILAAITLLLMVSPTHC